MNNFWENQPDDDLKSFICPNCNGSFEHAKGFRAHQLRHLKIKAEREHFDFCKTCHCVIFTGGKFKAKHHCTAEFGRQF